MSIYKEKDRLRYITKQIRQNGLSDQLHKYIVESYCEIYHSHAARNVRFR